MVSSSTSLQSTRYSRGSLQLLDQIRFMSIVGYVEKGHQVCDEMHEPGVVVWTAMVRAYVCFQLPAQALDLFKKTRECDVMPDSVALATVVSACSLANDLRVAKAVHGFVIRYEVVVDELFNVGVLSMYDDSASLELAYQILKWIPRKKLNNFVWNCMIFQFVQHDQLELARELFASMPKKDVVTWNTLIQGLCHVGRDKEALALFQEMESERVKVNSLTLLGALSPRSCLSVQQTMSDGKLQNGKLKFGWCLNVFCKWEAAKWEMYTLV